MSREKTHIPFVDLKAQFETLKDEMTEAIRGVLDSGRFIGGEAVARFEGDFAAYCQVRGRGRLRPEVMLEMDVDYAINWTLWTDLKLIALTFPAVLRGRGAR